MIIPSWPSVTEVNAVFWRKIKMLVATVLRSFVPKCVAVWFETGPMYECKNGNRNNGKWLNCVICWLPCIIVVAILLLRSRLLRKQ